MGFVEPGRKEVVAWRYSPEYLLTSSPPHSWADPLPLVVLGGTATPLPLTSAHLLELARPHFSSCRWDCELGLPGRYPLTLHALGGRGGLPPVPTPPNLYHPALAQLEGATHCPAGCWAGCWAGRAPLPSKGWQTALLFSLRSPSSNFTPLSPPTPIHSRITIHRQRRFTRPSPSRHILQSRQDHSSAPPEPIWPLQPSYPQHHLVYSMTCTSTPMNCIAPHSQVDTL